MELLVKIVCTHTADFTLQLLVLLFARWLSAAVRDGQLFVVTYLMNNFSHVAHFSATFSLASASAFF